MHKFILAVFIFSYIISFCSGQTHHSKQLSINDGLSHNTIEDVLQDSEGFMWFATHNGLNRYDGYQVITYQNNSNLENSISGNRLICINEDFLGNLWVGSSGNGVNKFDKEKEVFESYQSNRSKYSLPNNTINNIKVFKDSSIWICTNNGIAKYNKTNDNFTNYYLDYAEGENGTFVVYDALKTSKGEIYVASVHNYIFKLNVNNGIFTKVYYSRDSNLTGNYRKRLKEDKDGNIWISAFSHGLVKYNPNTGKSKVFTGNNSGLKTDLLNGDFIIHENKLWLTTDGSGIIKYDLNSKTFTSLEYNANKKNSIISNKIYSIFIDNQDIIWIGTFNEGVNILNPNQEKFSILKTKENHDFSMEGYSVLSIYEDKNETLWIGTDGDGLFTYSKEGIAERYKTNADITNSLSTERIICINQDKEGNLILGTYNGGMIVLNPKQNKFKRYLPNANNNDAIASNNIWDIFIDSKERIWVGLLNGGLDLFNNKNKQFTHYGPNTDNYNRINHSNVMGIIEDKDGDIWFGTEGRGVNILDNQSNQMFHSIHPSENKRLSNNNVHCIYEDSYGTIWLGTRNGGLNKYDKKSQTLEYFFMNDGLPSNIIHSIIEDGKQNLWLGTAYGLSRFNTQTNTFKNYDTKDGLLSYVYNRNAVLRRNDGTILVGSTNGLNVFHPDSIRDINYTPKAFFTNFRIDNTLVNIGDTINGRVVLERSLNYTKEIIIEPKDKIFTIEFAAKTFTLPEKCWFKYKLEGFDTDWKTTEASRQHITYTNLNPGSYVFKVKASNSDGVWSNYVAKMNITVLPSFWQSIWFKFVIVFVILLIFYAWYKYKLSLKEKQFLIEKEKQNQQISGLEKEKLESELNNQTFNILSRNKTLLKHKRRLSLLVNKVDEKTKKTLTDIVSEIDQEINEEKDWKHIEPRLDKVYNNFMTILKGRHTNLTQSELRIAAYVRMGLSTKEISELLQKTTKAIDNDRYRLRKKLDIPQNDSLKRYLLEL